MVKYQPISTALELLDDSSFGRDYKSFLNVYDRISAALQTIAHTHKDDFTRGISAYGEIMEGIQKCNSRIIALKQSLEASQECIGNTNSKELQQTLARSSQYKKVISVLKELNEANQLFDNFHTLVDSKQYYHASDLIRRVWDELSRSDFDGILVVEQFKSRMTGLLSHLEDILSEELVSITFLKDAVAYPIVSYCSPNPLRETSNPYFLRDFLKNNANTSTLGQSEQLRYLEEALSLKLSDCLKMDYGRDSLRDIRIVLESLNLLGKLPNAISSLKSRTSAEMFTTVDSTSRAIVNKYSLGNNVSTVNPFSKSLYDIGLHAETDREHTMISEFLTNLFTKLRCVLMHYRGISEFMTKLETKTPKHASSSHKSSIMSVNSDPTSPKVSKFDTSDSTFPFDTLLQAFESEIRLMLKDYLISKEEYIENSGNFVVGTEMSIYNLPGENEEDKLFDVTNEIAVENKSNAFYARINELVNEKAPELILNKSNASVSTIELFSGSSKEIVRLAGHVVFVGPSVFHASSVLPQTVFFLEDSVSILKNPNIPPQFAVNFMKEFLRGSYIPQLYKFMSSHFDTIMKDVGAFQLHRDWKIYSKIPIFKCHVAIVQYFHDLQDYLPIVALNLVEFYELLHTLLVRFRNHCSDYLSDLCRTAVLKEYKHVNEDTEDVDDTVRVKLLHDDVTYPQFIKFLKQKNPSLEGLNELCRMENKRLLQYEDRAITSEVKLPVSVLSKDSDLVNSVSYLHNSMEWFLQRCFSRFMNGSRRMNVLQQNQANFGGDFLPIDNLLGNNSDLMKGYVTVCIELYTDFYKSAYKEVFDSLQRLQFDALLLIRMEVRLQYIHSINQSVNLPDYVVEYRGRPDASIMALNSTIVTTNLKLETCLNEWERRFVFQGLSELVDSSLYSIFYKIESMNRGSCLQMLKNMSAMIQILKTVKEIHGDVEFPKSSRVFGIYQNGAKKIIEHFIAAPKKELLPDVKQMVRIYYQRLMKDAKRNGRDDLYRQYQKKIGSVLTQFDNTVGGARKNP